MNRIKYWVIKTGAKSHINDFLIASKYFQIGDKVYTDFSDDQFPAVVVNGNSIFRKGKNAFNQMIIGWEALGLVRKEINHYVVICPFDDMNSIIQYSKIWIVKYSEDERIQSYRNSKMINTLLFAKHITFTDLKAAGVYQQKGELSIDKIRKEISYYEKEISKDKELLTKMKEELKNDK